MITFFTVPKTKRKKNKVNWWFPNIRFFGFHGFRFRNSGFRFYSKNGTKFGIGRMRKRWDAKNSHRDYWIEELYWGLTKSKTIFYDVVLFRKWLGLKRILLSDWPPKLEELAYLGHSGFPPCPASLFGQDG